jgi:hypothetical protein
MFVALVSCIAQFCSLSLFSCVCIKLRGPACVSGRSDWDLCLETGFAQSAEVYAEMIDQILLHCFRFIINSCYAVPYYVFCTYGCVVKSTRNNIHFTRLLLWHTWCDIAFTDQEGVEFIVFEGQCLEFWSVSHSDKHSKRTPIILLSTSQIISSGTSDDKTMFPKSLIYEIWGRHIALLQIRFFSNTTECGLVYGYRGFGEISFLHLQGSFLFVYVKVWETNYSKIFLTTYQLALRLVSEN